MIRVAKLKEPSSNPACTRFGDCLYENYISLGHSREICLSFFLFLFFSVLFFHSSLSI